MTDALPISYPLDLSSVPKAGYEKTFRIPEAACGAIAKSYDINGIEDFTVRFQLSRISVDEYALQGHFSAAILQTCILTLKPMRTLVEQDFERHYDIVASRSPRHAVSATTVELESEDRETLQGTSLDLALPLLEELSLAIDPYPKAPGSRFEGGPTENPSKESPFAVLQALKDQMEPPKKT